ncbi:MAG TPA: hypothetical protein VEW64_02820 [Methyloceanibacter sp.]|jgi:uncharacterized cupredoxin-like copper-binding protein|nr:hypothetical protein [Methyloceanibacter sp.]
MRSLVIVTFVSLAVTIPSACHAAEEESAAGAPENVQGQILDPAAHNLVRLEPLMLGSENDSAHMEPREYRLKVGQGYRWKIKASDQSEYAFVAPAFFRNIWIRKVEAGDVEIKAAILDEIEFESGGEAELFFVAVRPGTYDFGSRGLMERGLVGKIIVESDGKIVPN